jgi:hypothetical protein
MTEQPPTKKYAVCISPHSQVYGFRFILIGQHDSIEECKNHVENLNLCYKPRNNHDLLYVNWCAVLEQTENPDRHKIILKKYDNRQWQDEDYGSVWSINAIEKWAKAKIKPYQLKKTTTTPIKTNATIHSKAV